MLPAQCLELASKRDDVSVDLVMLTHEDAEVATAKLDRDVVEEFVQTPLTVGEPPVAGECLRVALGERIFNFIGHHMLIG